MSPPVVRGLPASGALPKRKHENLARLSADDQQRVQRMAAILRVAGGLDRSRSQQVRDAVVKVADGRVVIEAVAEVEPQVDLWGAERRVDLFEKAFGMPLAIRWAGATPRNGRQHPKPSKPVKPARDPSADSV